MSNEWRSLICPTKVWSRSVSPTENSNSSRTGLLSGEKHSSTNASKDFFLRKAADQIRDLFRIFATTVLRQTPLPPFDERERSLSLLEPAAEVECVALRLTRSNNRWTRAFA